MNEVINVINVGIITTNQLKLINSNDFRMIEAIANISIKVIK
jgi:hypothetical protein